MTDLLLSIAAVCGSLALGVLAFAAFMSRLQTRD
jgi:hypothetical protein